MGQVRLQQSIDEPLLYSGIKKTPPALALFVISWVKWVLKLVIWVIFVAWVTLIFFYPTNFMNKLFTKWIHATSGPPFGITGSVFLSFSGPVLVIALLSVVYHITSAFSDHDELFGTTKPKRPSFRLWTFPVLVDGPFQVVSATEFIGIVLFVIYVLWTLYYYAVKALGELPDKSTFKLNCALILDFMGFRLGSIGLFCLAFLFLPISRGSVLLRLIEIPFEHATRYHVWLGHLTMLLFTLHGLFYIIAWTIRGTLLREILEWKDIGIANLPGVISLTAGVLMWVTSLRPVRTNKFELFFYTHQLYVLFVIFLALHVGDFVFSIAAGGIFLFMLDRFLRFCQSRKTVDVISAKCLPCGTLELVLSKPQSLRYNALSFIFIQIRELSWLQWHPFSVSSSPLDGKYHMSVLIKVLGKWTANLRAKILNEELDAEPEKQLPHSNKITASVEGPYGHDSPYYLMYENLVLVAGGIGLSPFLAILSDILHRVEDGKPCRPKNILVVWAVKKSNELSLLSTMQSICPNFSDKLNLKIHIYITREAGPPLEEGKEGYQSLATDSTASQCPLSKVSSSPMSVLVGTGDSIWSGLYVILSMLGFLVLLYLLHIYYINVFGIYKWWYKGLLFLGCMAASTVIFGGLVIGFWHVYEEWNSKNLAYEKADEDTKVVKEKQIGTPTQLQNGSSCATQLADSAVVQYGSRPDFKDILESVSVRWGPVDVGVFVCGPPTLQSSVAREIRSHSVRRQGQHDPIFHFNSHSFDL